MDDDTLESLEAALVATPDNAPLRAVLLRAYQEREECEAGVALLEDVAPEQLATPDDRQVAARLLLSGGRPADALRFATDAPDGQLVRARAFLALDRRDEAQAAYDAAVAENPTLEDRDLAQALTARVTPATRTTSGGAEVVPLRVIANDDTEDHEVQRLLHPPETAVTFVDVGGLADLKNQIHRKIILPFQKPSLFAKFKKRVGGGILLYGPPGCGKTLLARATAGECEAAFVNVAISDVLDMYIGESEQRLHAVFDKARASVPAVLFFDELEALGGKRQHTREATSSKLVSQFLAEMDGFSRNNEGVLVMGATNVPWAVDPAFRRPGRFDRVVFVPPPDREAREAILRLQLRDRPTAGDLPLGRLARQTSGYSGADLVHLVETAVEEAIEASLEAGEEVPIVAKHLLRALQSTRPTTLEWLTTARNYARYANEAGQYDEVLAFLSKHGKS